MSTEKPGRSYTPPKYQLAHHETTGHTIIEVAEWLLVHDDGMPYQITDTITGIIYELTARRIKPDEAYGYETTDPV